MSKKRILIISSNHTGHGHKSIAESLCEHFVSYPDVEIKVIDGFNLAGNIGLKVGKMYGSLTRNAKDLWKMVWDISHKRPAFINEFTQLAIKDKFIKELKEYQPHLILTVHPNFNGSVINILNEYDLKIPYVTLIADLVSISPLWADPRADFTICPSIESYDKCIEFGVPEERLKLIGFPTRQRFLKHIGTEADTKREYSPDRPLECLIMSGGEGVGNMSRIAKILLKNFNCNVSIIAGRNNILRKRLERSFEDVEKYGNRIKIYGFLENIQDLMLASDIAFTRGSPNTMLEAVCCNVPLVITGALPGQEEGNPGYALKYNLGIVCDDLRQLKHEVSELLADNAKKLNSIKQSQRDFRNPDIAKNIVDFIMGIEVPEKIDYDKLPDDKKVLGIKISKIPRSPKNKLIKTDKIKKPVRVKRTKVK